MAVYRRDTEPSAEWQRKRHRLGMAVLICLGAAVGGFSLHHAFAFVLSIYAVIFGAFLALAYFRLPRSRRREQYTVTPAGVSRQGPGQPDVFLRRDEIRGYLKRPGKIVLVTGRWERRLSVPDDLAGWNGFRRELSQLRILALPDDYAGQRNWKTAVTGIFRSQAREGFVGLLIILLTLVASFVRLPKQNVQRWSRALEMAGLLITLIVSIAMRRWRRHRA